MKRQDFSFDLPEDLIADQPCARRSDSRLLCLNGASGQIVHKRFIDLPDLLQPGDLLVFNNTKVIPARLYGAKPTGGKAEILAERILSPQTILAHVKASKAPGEGSSILLPDETEILVEGRQDNFFILSLPEGRNWPELLEKHGQMPLPHYMQREEKAIDRERYQTVYAEKPGAVAAPTAGLHFDEALLETLKAKGIETAFVTLHVGAGTFQPVRTDDIREHKMHAEYLEVDENTCAKVMETRRGGGRIIAVGTTSVRCLETAWKDDKLHPFMGDTNIFIYPGYRFQCVDALVTNFHLPESTLLMLVCAFAGFENIMTAYKAAVTENYRFFSYGDAMFITQNPDADGPD